MRDFKILAIAIVAACSLPAPGFAQIDPPEVGPETELMEGFDLAIGPENAPGNFGEPGIAVPWPPTPGEGPVDILAFRPRHGWGGPPWAGGPSGCGLLGPLEDDTFTDDQLEKMYQAKQDFLDKSGPKMVELRAQHRALKDALMQPELDSKKLQAIQTRINGLIGDLASLKLDKEVAMMSALTPEQRKELRRSYLKRADFGPMAGRMKHCKKVRESRREERRDDRQYPE